MTFHGNSDYEESRMMPCDFWKSVDILMRKPHITNKKLWGSKTIFMIHCKPHTIDWEVIKQWKLMDSLEDKDICMEQFLQKINMVICAEEDPAHTTIVLLELLPKTYTQNHAYQLIILNRQGISATFFDVTPESKPQNICPNFTYSFNLNNSRVYLTSECVVSKSYQWLKDKVLPQFVKWGEETIDNSIESLSLICTEKYYEKYNNLKLKYGKEMVKIWPECTDPSKYVYEDVAIATYLLLLWEDERSRFNLNSLQTFVDLGCGNGLLVYILISEGHKGVGIDVRKRQIWNMYPEIITLEERTITPSDSNLFPKTDWIIGNHSDELTPWIPVIAARSSYNCNFFLLPCCAYNFNGTKYQRQNSSISQYNEYLQYIKRLCEDCGFNTDTDRLKIPSTKRICVIGRGRTYPKQDYEKYCTKIQQIINTGVKTTNPNENLWLDGFKARETTEKVRNCTQLDKNLIESIVREVSGYLLEGCDTSSEWTIGKTVEINEVVQLLSQDKLKALKSECGGLQTLMRNNHHIFKVQSGKVQLRFPKTVDEVSSKINDKNKSSNIKVQQKPCWFYNNHPQGCPLLNDKCSYLHVRG